MLFSGSSNALCFRVESAYVCLYFAILMYVLGLMLDDRQLNGWLLRAGGRARGCSIATSIAMIRLRRPLCLCHLMITLGVIVVSILIMIHHLCATWLLISIHGGCVRYLHGHRSLAGSLRGKLIHLSIAALIGE